MDEPMAKIVRPDVMRARSFFGNRFAGQRICSTVVMTTQYARLPATDPSRLSERGRESRQEQRRAFAAIVALYHAPVGEWTRIGCRITKDSQRRFFSMMP
jgi:hypothetical protein